MTNRETQYTLDDAVSEVLACLTGLDLEYSPAADRYVAVARALNRGLRAVALEHEWSYFSSVEHVGTGFLGMENIELSPSQRLRIINDDALRLQDAEGKTLKWCYFLPRDALHKYAERLGIWAAITRSTITFSRPFRLEEVGLAVMAPVMREPRMFKLPKSGSAVGPSIQNQLIDFDYPDLVIARAAMYVADSDPVMQPRVQTLEARYKDIMYQLVERDDRATDSPYENDFMVPIQGSINGSSYHEFVHGHPHADERH